MRALFQAKDVTTHEDLEFIGVTSVLVLADAYLATFAPDKFGVYNQTCVPREHYNLRGVTVNEDAQE